MNMKQIIRPLIAALLGAVIFVPGIMAATAGADPGGGRDKGPVITRGAVTQLSPARREVALVFTAADMADGADTIISTLRRYKVRGHFFFTGTFFRRFPGVVKRLLADGHYVGCHGYTHMLYFPWDRSDTMLVTRQQFNADLDSAYAVMRPFGITRRKAYYFIAPFEHFNDTVSAWARDIGLQLINNTYGTLTYGDYTTPSMKRYYSSDYIMKRTLDMAAASPSGINGHLLLIHLGTVSERTDKFYNRLPELITRLREMGYSFADLSKRIPRPAARRSSAR